MQKPANDTFEKSLSKYSKFFYLHIVVILIIAIFLSVYIKGCDREEKPVEERKPLAFYKASIGDTGIKPIITTKIDEVVLAEAESEEKVKSFSAPKTIEVEKSSVVTYNVDNDLNRVKKLYLDYTKNFDYNYILDYLEKENKNINVPNNENIESELFLEGTFKKDGSVKIDNYVGDEYVLSDINKRLTSKSSSFSVIITKSPFSSDEKVDFDKSNVKQSYYINSSFVNNSFKINTFGDYKNNYVEFIIILYYDNVGLKNMSNFEETHFSAKIQVLK